LILFSLLISCVSSTGIVSIGEDTYMIGKSTNLQASSTIVKASAFREASKFCADKNRHIQVVHTSEKDMALGHNMTTVELQFMCLRQDDPELQRPKLKKEADVVIEKKEDVSIDVKLKDQAENEKDVYTELIRLDDLRKKGIITEDEFETLKRKLLGED
jgi:predicted AAA+ superfamily ATPase